MLRCLVRNVGIYKLLIQISTTLKLLFLYLLYYVYRVSLKLDWQVQLNFQQALHKQHVPLKYCFTSLHDTWKRFILLFIPCISPPLWHHQASHWFSSSLKIQYSVKCQSLCFNLPTVTVCFSDYYLETQDWFPLCRLRFNENTVFCYWSCYFFSFFPDMFKIN